MTGTTIRPEAWESDALCRGDLEFCDRPIPDQLTLCQQPHIRVGDPCHDCGTPLVPASRRWWSWTIPPGHSKHAGLGLCGSCAGRRRRSGPLDPTAQQ